MRPRINAVLIISLFGHFAFHGLAFHGSPILCIATLNKVERCKARRKDLFSGVSNAGLMGWVECACVCGGCGGGVRWICSRRSE